MVISDIKIRKLFDEGPMKAIVSVTFDNQLAVHDIKVIYAREKFFIVMPSRKNPDGTIPGISFIRSMWNFVLCWSRQSLRLITQEKEAFDNGTSILCRKAEEHPHEEAPQEE